MGHVPAMIVTVHGEQYTAANPTSAEFRFTATRDDDGVHLRLEDTAGTALTSATLTVEQAAAQRAQLVNQPHVDLPRIADGLPAVERVVRWVFSDYQTYHVALVSELEELSEWLTYATGQDTWDPTVDGDTWEY